MSLNIADMQAGNEVEPIEEGSYPAVITGIVTYGIQAQTDWQTGEPKPSEKRMGVTYEFPTEAVEKEQEDGTVRMMARRLTKEMKVSSHKKAGIMVLIRSIAPSIKQLSELIGKGATVTVGRTGTGKAKVASVSPLMKGLDTPVALEAPVCFDFYEPEEEAFKRLTKWQQDMIVSAEDYNGFADSWVTKGEDY